MRKLAYLFLMILGILITILVTDKFNEYFYDKICNTTSIMEENVATYNIYTFINMGNSDGEQVDVIDNLINFAEENNISLMIQKVKTDELNRMTRLNFIYSNKLNLSEEFYLKDEESIDFSNVNEKRYFTTDKIDDDNAIRIKMLSDKYSDGIKKDLIEIRPFHQYSDIIKDNQEIYVGFWGDSTENLAKIVGAEFNIPNDRFDIMESHPFKMEKDYTTLGICIAIVILILILITCEVNKRVKEVSIRKLYGNSKLKILWRILGGFIITSFSIFFISIMITFAILINEISKLSLPIIKSLVVISILTVIGYCLIVCITYLIIKFLVTASNIKKSGVNYKIVNANIFMKYIIIIIIISPFINTLVTAYNSFDELKILEDNYDLLKYRYSINNIKYYGDKRDKENHENIYETLDENGVIYADTQNLELYYTLDMNPWGQPFIPTICVNKNYLKDYNVELIDGTILNLDDVQGMTYLVPAKYKNKNYNKYYSVDNYENIIVKGGMKYYNLSITDKYKFIEDPVILITDGYYRKIKLQYPNIYFSDDENIKECLRDVGLSDQCSIFDTTKWVGILKEIYIEDIMEAIITLVIYTIIILVFLYQSVYLYMEETRRLISVQYLLGHSKISRYSEVIVMNLAPHALMFMISIIFLEIPTKLIFNFCLTFMLIEFLFMVYMIKKFEKNTVIVVLKGE